MGLGSGRCGTLSLSTLLDAQYQVNVTHERGFRLPWNPVDYYLTLTLDSLFKQYMGAWVGDVAYWYLPYVERILQLYPDTKFVCLRRDREETIASQMRCGISLGSMHHVRADSKYYDHKVAPLNSFIKFPCRS